MAMTLEGWRTEGEYCQYRGHSIFQVSGGDGPALLLLHGWPTSSWDFAPIWEDACRHYSSHAPDLLGNGFSAKPQDYDYSMMDQADFVEAFVRGQGLAGPIRIVAHDYSVAIAQELLHRHNAGELTFALHKVCFLNGGLFPEVYQPRLLQKLLNSPLGFMTTRFITRGLFGRRFSQVFGPHTQPSEAELDDFWSCLTHNDGLSIEHKLCRLTLDRERFAKRWSAALRETGIPLRFINGPLDPNSGAHMAQRYREVVPDPDVVSLPEIGHYPHVEAPQATWDAIAEFMVD